LDRAEPPLRIAEEVEADDLEDPLALPRVDGADVPELRHEPRLDACLLLGLAPRRRVRLLAFADQALRKRPDPRFLASKTYGGADPLAAQPPDRTPAGGELAAHREFVTRRSRPATTLHIQIATIRLAQRRAPQLHCPGTRSAG